MGAIQSQWWARGPCLPSLRGADRMLAQAVMVSPRQPQGPGSERDYRRRHRTARPARDGLDTKCFAVTARRAGLSAGPCCLPSTPLDKQLGLSGPQCAHKGHDSPSREGSWATRPRLTSHMQPSFQSPVPGRNTPSIAQNMVPTANARRHMWLWDEGCGEHRAAPSRQQESQRSHLGGPAPEALSDP